MPFVKRQKSAKMEKIMAEIYFDNSATTRISEEALAEYVRVSREIYGNPSSRHRLGFLAEEAIKGASDKLQRALGSREGRIVFTSGGTEGNNLAILGRAYAKERYRGGRILTTAGEHSSVSHTLASLESEGFEVKEIPTENGVLDLNALSSLLTPRTVLVTVMAVNNETGAVYPLKKVSDMMRRVCPEAVLHVDATQSFMKMPFTPKSIGADMITLSSHKIEGPKGVGALWVSDALLKARGLAPVVFGGGQQLGLRSGTENVPGICAFAEAARLGYESFSRRVEKMRSLRACLLSGIAESEALKEALTPNLPLGECAPHIVSLVVKGMKSETVLNDLSGRGIYVSSGSACSSHEKSLSSALLAFGKTADEADSTVRVSFSHHNTEEEIGALLSALTEIVSTRAKKH